MELEQTYRIKNITSNLSRLSKLDFDESLKLEINKTIQDSYEKVPRGATICNATVYYVDPDVDKTTTYYHFDFYNKTVAIVNDSIEITVKVNFYYDNGNDTSNHGFFEKIKNFFDSRLAKGSLA